jgi:hypothetical protein
LLVAACGSAPPPAPTPSPRAPVAPKPAPSPVTCGDAGVILRGTVENAKEAGPSKEAAIASACLHDKWPAAMLACVGADAEPESCYDQLEPAQLAGLNKILQAWSEAHSEPFLGVGAPPKVVTTDCAEGIGDVATYAPPLAVTGEERGFATALRRSTIDALCRAGWPEPVRACFTSGKASEVCRAMLSKNLQRVLADQIAQLDAVIAKALAARTKAAAAYDCKRVVASHYSDAAWNANYPAPRDPKRAQERKTMIAAQRTKMTAACTNESWNATARACIVAGAGSACFRAIGVNPDLWGYAPPPNIGVPECDSYATRMVSYLSCAQIPEHIRTQRQRDFEAEIQRWMNVQLDMRTRFRTACKAADETLRTTARNYGCAI